jgi:hypothetical protein
MSKKNKVMEALLTSNVNLNSEDLMWINSHLPNDEGMGKHKKVYKFDHNSDNLFTSIGITDEVAMQAAEVFAEATKNLLMKDDYSMSNAVEEILNNSTDIPHFEALLVSKVLRNSVDNIQEAKGAMGDLPRALAQLLRVMKKREDNNED